MTMITPSYLGETIEYSSLHACRSTLEDPTVVCENRRVIGYYTLAPGAITVASAPGRFRRNMPDPIPVVLLGRLAVDRGWSGRGFGRALFRDAARRVANAADAIGIRGIVVHAISAEAKNFYLALGFDASPSDPMVLTVTLADVRAALDPSTSTGRKQEGGRWGAACPPAARASSPALVQDKRHRLRYRRRGLPTPVPIVARPRPSHDERNATRPRTILNSPVPTIPM